MRRYRFGRPPRRQPMSLKSALQRRRRPKFRLPNQLGNLSWKAHLRTIYRKSPALYRIWRSETYQKIIVAPRPKLDYQLHYHAMQPSAAHKPLLEPSTFFTNHAVLWVYFHRHLQLPVRWGWQRADEYAYRTALLQQVLRANDPHRQALLLNRYLNTIGWTRAELGHYLNAPTLDVIRSRYRKIREWVLQHYDALLNLPTISTCAFFGDPRLQQMFFPFQQHYSYRRMEYELLHQLHPHTTKPGLRPTQSLGSWIDRVRYLSFYLNRKTETPQQDSNERGNCSHGENLPTQRVESAHANP